MGEQHTPTLSRVTRESGLVIIHIQGELDSFGTGEIALAFSTALGDRTVHAVVDLGEVSFISSRAVALFLSHTQMLRRAGGDLRLAGANKSITRIFELAGFGSLIPSSTLEEAITEMEAGLSKG